MSSALSSKKEIYFMYTGMSAREKLVLARRDAFRCLARLEGGSAAEPRHFPVKGLFQKAFLLRREVEDGGHSLG